MKKLFLMAALFFGPLPVFAQDGSIVTAPQQLRPVARSGLLPRTRWDFQTGSYLWTRAAMSAIATHAAVLTTLVPRDIATWCPGYETASDEERRAFWVGMMSALSKFESTYNPRAVGGGGQWYGLLQIYPDTARRYGCYARTGADLLDPANNLNCAARIMAVTVARDNAIAVNDGRWRGVAADWGPMTRRSKISDMANWTAAQTYCAAPGSLRPVVRPRFSDATSTVTATTPQD